MNRYKCKQLVNTLKDNNDGMELLQKHYKDAMTVRKDDESVDNALYISDSISTKQIPNQKIHKGLTWYGNSCYADSFLIIFLNSSIWKDIIENHKDDLDEDLISELIKIQLIMTTDSIDMDDLSGDDFACIIENSMSEDEDEVQSEDEDEVYYEDEEEIDKYSVCNLRKIIKKLQVNESGNKYYTADIQDTNDFIGFMSRVLKIEEKESILVVRTRTYHSGYKDIKFEKQTTNFICSTSTCMNTIDIQSLCNIRNENPIFIEETRIYNPGNYLVLQIPQHVKKEINLLGCLSFVADINLIKIYLTGIICFSHGHYVCYFKTGNDWYFYNDIGTSIKKIDSLESIDKDIKNSMLRITTLIYDYKEEEELPNVEKKLQIVISKKDVENKTYKCIKNTLMLTGCSEFRQYADSSNNIYTVLYTSDDNTDRFKNMYGYVSRDVYIKMLKTKNNIIEIIDDESFELNVINPNPNHYVINGDIFDREFSEGSIELESLTRLIKIKSPPDRNIINLQHTFFTIS